MRFKNLAGEKTVIRNLKFVIQKKAQKFGKCPKVGGLPPIKA
jgi:hypothetical protein